MCIMQKWENAFRGAFQRLWKIWSEFQLRDQSPQPEFDPFLAKAEWFAPQENPISYILSAIILLYEHQLRILKERF